MKVLSILEIQMFLILGFLVFENLWCMMGTLIPISALMYGLMVEKQESMTPYKS